jgi:hypothetical protein
LLHFPFQLAIVGVVEGSQQIAMARYVLKSAAKGTADLQQYCKADNLDGAKLRDALIKMIDYYQFKSKIDTYDYYNEILDTIYSIGNSTGICSAQNVTNYNGGDTWPVDFTFIDQSISNGIYAGLGVKMPIDKLQEHMDPIDIAEKGWRLTYLYFWSCFCVLILSLIVFLFLIRRHKVDAFDYISVIIRCLVLGVGAAMLAILANKQRLFDLLNSPALLPMCVVLLFVIICCDKLATLWCNWRLIKSGQPYALEFEEEHHHSSGHGDAHGEIIMTDDAEAGYMRGHGRPAHRKSAGWSVDIDTIGLAKENTGYSSNHSQDSTHGIEETHTPPLQSISPSLMTPVMGPSGYMPVAH